MKALKFSRKNLGIPYAAFIAIFVVLPLLLIVLYAFTVERGEPTTNDITKFSFSFENFVYFSAVPRTSARFTSVSGLR